VSESQSALVDEVAALNEAAGDVRYFLSAPTNALADYTIRDRDLVNRHEGDVVAEHFCLRDARADVDRRNAEVARAIRSATDTRQGWRSDAESPPLIIGLGLSLGGLLLALTAVVLLWWPQIAHLVAGWLR
jgi:hypothetical protein